MFKKLMSAVAAAALCVSLAACGATATSEAATEATATPAPAVTEAPAEETASAETADGALRVAGLKGPTTMGLVNLMAGEDAADYDFEMYGKADEIVPQLVKGELDAAAVPANLAATLYQKTNGAIEVACIPGRAVRCGKRRDCEQRGGPEGQDHRDNRQGYYPGICSALHPD